MNEQTLPQKTPANSKPSIADLNTQEPLLASRKECIDQCGIHLTRCLAAADTDVERILCQDAYDRCCIQCVPD